MPFSRAKSVADSPVVRRSSFIRRAIAGRMRGSRRLGLFQAAREQVKVDLDAARRVPPKVKGDVALIRFHSPCQIHPLVAQAWRGRLRNNIVIAANTGYRPGWVHFATRTALDLDLIAFLQDHAPEGADENYGSGHRQATGGALRSESWNQFVTGLGFGPDMLVEA
jgi:single-stranded-DNA-specific exonuclease